MIASKFGKHPALWETSVPPPPRPTPTSRSFSLPGHRSDDPAPAVPYSGEMVSAALAQSLSLLQMDTIDLYQIHVSAAALFVSSFEVSKKRGCTGGGGLRSPTARRTGSTMASSPTSCSRAASRAPRRRRSTT